METDELFAHAIRKLSGLNLTGERLPSNPPVGALYLQPEFRRALANCGAPFVDSGEPRPTLPHWRGTLLGFDVVVRSTSAGPPKSVAETKVEKTDEVLWDLYKVIDALCVGVEAGYLVVAATRSQWDRPTNYCTEIFCSDAPESSLKLFEDNKKAWLGLLKGGSARPTSVAARISITPIESRPVKIRGVEGSLRCIRVAEQREDRLEFDPGHFCGEWPLGVEPCPEWFVWKEQRRARPGRSQDGRRSPTTRGVSSGSVARIVVSPTADGAHAKVFEGSNDIPTQYALVETPANWLVKAVITTAGTILRKEPPVDIPGWVRGPMSAALAEFEHRDRDPIEWRPR